MAQITNLPDEKIFVMDNLDVPEHVSYAVRDAWNAIPPCSYSLHPFCHVDCPYHYECFPDFYDNDDDCDL